MAAVYRKKRLLLVALPMGFIDFLVPFASNAIVIFEAVVFGLSLLSLGVAWYATNRVKKSLRNPSIASQNAD